MINMEYNDEIVSANCKMFFDLLAVGKDDEARKVLAHVIRTGEHQSMKCKITNSNEYSMEQKALFWEILFKVTEQGHQPSPCPQNTTHNFGRYYSSHSAHTIINNNSFKSPKERQNNEEGRDTAIPDRKKTVGDSTLGATACP